MTSTHKFPNRLQKILIRRENIRSKSTKMGITLLINQKDLIQGFYANYERLIIGKKVVHIQSIGEMKTSQQLPRNKNIQSKSYL